MIKVLFYNWIYLFFWICCSIKPDWIFFHLRHIRFLITRQSSNVNRMNSIKQKIQVFSDIVYIYRENLPTTTTSPCSDTVWNDGASALTSHRKRPEDTRSTDCNTTAVSVDAFNCNQIFYGYDDIVYHIYKLHISYYYCRA